ncbi:MAG: glycosyltransferase family 1 protein [Patescibacteria group bacterium]
MKRKLVIGIDASRAVRAVRTGPESYSWEIIRQLVQIPSSHTFRLYSPTQPPSNFLPKRTNVEWRILPQRRLWSQVRLAKELKDNRPDVLFVPSHVVPFFSNVPTVVTLHDVSYKYFPRQYSTFDRRYLNFSTAVSLGRSKTVLTPTEATKSDLVKFYKADPSRIVVTPLGYNRELYHPPKPGEKPPLDDPYIMFVGRIEDKKNVGLLVDAFSLLSKEQKKVKLLLVGRSGYGYEGIKMKIDRLPPAAKQNVLMPGYIPHYDAALYLRHASVFAFPSRHEGFGLAALEALACGTPVVASNTPALAEMIGGAGVSLPSENPLTWAAALSRVLNQPSYAQELKDKSLARAKLYSWEKAAQMTLEVLEHAAT